MEKIRGLKIYSEKISGLKNLGFSGENTPDGYSPLKMTAPLKGRGKGSDSHDEKKRTALFSTH